MFKNSVKTVLVLAGLGALFMGIGSFFGHDRPRDRPDPRPRVRRRLLLVLRQARGTRRRRPTVTEAEAPKLYAMVRDLTSRTGMPMPAIYISPAAQPNAFATGRNPTTPRSR